jgi:hypothetical protein
VAIKVQLILRTVFLLSILHLVHHSVLITFLTPSVIRDIREALESRVDYFSLNSDLKLACRRYLAYTEMLRVGTHHDIVYGITGLTIVTCEVKKYYEIFVAVKYIVRN